MPRLRQLVLAAHELAPVEQALRQFLAASAAHHDPGVGRFGLTNAVLAPGCDFVEVVSPAAPGTALAVREVHRVVLPDVVDVHLHPEDTGGVLLALDAVDPARSWRWAGPAWTGDSPTCAGVLREVTVAVPDPGEVVRRWAALLDVTAVASDCRLEVDDGRQHLSFIDGAGDVAAVTAARLALPGAEPRTADVGGVRCDVVPLEEEM